MEDVEDVSDLEVPTKETPPCLDNQKEEDPEEEEDFEDFLRDVTQRRRSSTVQPGKKTKEERKHHHRRHKKSDDAGGPSEKVKVIVRCRPLSEKERLQGHSKIIQIAENRKAIEVHRPNPSSGNIVNAKVDKVFHFDSVYDESTTQGELYEESFSELVDSVLEGFNGTIFAYGQTGTGKTYTMEGVREIREEQGVIPNAFRHIFDRIHNSPDLTCLVRASYLEIYQEEVKDLLSPKLKICELKENSDGVYIKGLTSFLCRDFDEINKLMTQGNTHRSIGATNMNEHSSRSHAVFMIAVEMSETWADGESHIKVGRLNLVDLAGSERQGKTGAEGERLKEAVKINLSLSALGNVIGALADGKNGHIPYRDSKLTRLLQDSLGGNSRTIMVATVGPASFNYDETMVTLRYASRAKRIKNKPKINEDPKDAILRNYQVEIAKLRALLDARGGQPRSADEEDEDSGRVRTGRRSRPKFVGSPIFDPSLIKELEPYLEGDLQSDPKEILRILEEKRTALLSDTATVTEEKKRLIGKLESTQKKVEQAEADCGKLHDRVEWLESKVLNGGKNLLDHTNDQQRLIEERQRELDEEKVKEDEIRDKIQEHDLTVVELRDIKTGMETSVGFESKRYRKLEAKLAQARKEREERTQKHGFDVAKLQRYLAHNQKEDSMNKAILDNFVPVRMARLLDSLAQHNSADDSFSFMPMTSVILPRPLVNRMCLLPLFNKTATRDLVPREDFYYVDENILQVHPIPPRTYTRHYIPPDTDPHIKSVMMRALAEAEKEVAIDCHRINLTSSKRRAKTARVRLGEILTFENNMTVRQVLSAKHRSKEIPYKDFVAVMRVERGQSAIPFKNQFRRANHVSLSPDFFPTPPPSALTAPLTRSKHTPPHPPGDFSGVKSGSTLPRHFGEPTRSPFDPCHLEGNSTERRTPSSTTEISLRKLEEVLAKRKMLANLQHQRKPSLSDYSHSPWINSLYSETPPCTANPQYLEPEDRKLGNGRRISEPPFSNLAAHAHGHLDPHEPKLSNHRLKSLTPEQIPSFREARHFGTGDLRRDPLTARTNSYPPGTPSRPGTNSSRVVPNLHPADPWVRLNPRRSSLGFTTPPSTEFAEKFPNRRHSTPSNLRGLGYSPISKMSSTPSSSSFHFLTQV